MKKVATFLLAILCLQFTSAQQDAQLTGRIVNAAAEPISFATIMLHSAVDTALVKAQVSELAGNFHFQNLQAGDYFLKITYVGFTDYISSTIELSAGEERHLPNILLSEQAEELQAVVVKASRPIVEVHPDKTIFNIEGSINASGNDALELLRKAPGVVVDNNERIMLMGKNGVQVYIDGKRSPLSADDLSDFLRTLQSSDIDAIEIITNPSAKYEAEGNAGIINIRLKKDKSLGTNGSVTSSFRQGVTPKINNSLSFNHRNKQLNIFGRYGNNFGQWRNVNNIHRFQVGQGFDAHSDMVSDDESHQFRLGSDLFINKHSTMGFLVSGALNEGHWSNEARTHIYDLESQLTNGYLLATNNIIGNRDNLQANVNYALKKEGGTTLNMDVDYALYRNNGDSYQPNKYMDASESLLLEERIFRSITPTDIDMYTFKIDYEKNVGAGKLAMGAKSSYVTTDNTFNFFDVIDGEELLNGDRSNNFVYQENVNAVYSTFQWQKNKFNVMLGLRLEHTHSKGDLSSSQVINNEVVERDYVNLFPSAGITFNTSDKHSWRLNYSRRIDRPSYQDLNPFEFKLDELTFQKGNAFLNPQYTHGFSLTHTFKHRLNTTLSYSITDDLITEITDTFSADASFITYVNIAKQNNVSLAVSYPFSVSKWWSVYSNATVYRVHNKADFGGAKIVDISANVFNFYAQNTFMLPRGLKLEVSGFYNSPGLWGGNFRTESMWSMDLGIQTKLFKEKANLKLALTDVFRTQRWTGENSLGALNIVASGNWESRQFRATLTYNFGNEQVKGSRSRRTGLEEETKRVK